MSAEGHYALVSFLAYGNIFEAGLIERFADAGRNIGDCVAIFSHPTSTPTIISARNPNQNTLSDFIAVLSINHRNGPSRSRLVLNTGPVQVTNHAELQRGR